jgi:hypothetical protein
MLRLLFFFIIFKTLVLNTYAQRFKGYSLETQFHFGKIFKHTPKLKFPIPPLSYGIEIHNDWQLYGKKNWHVWHRYPSVGASFLYFNLGNKDILGEAYGLFPTLRFNIFNKKSFKTTFQLGSGLAYLTKRYEIGNNTLNNAIGARVNDVTQFNCQVEISLDKIFSIESGVNLTHFSNANSRVPNLGINIFSYDIGLKWTPQPIDKHDFISTYVDKHVDKHWGLTVQTEYARIAYDVPRGPKYPIYIVLPAIIYNFNKINRIQAGFQYEHNQGVYEFIRHAGVATSKEEAEKMSKRYSVFIADEILFGRFGILLQTGFNLNKKSGYNVKDFYNKIGVRYYSPRITALKTQFYSGIYLKSHIITAEYFSLGIGIIY